MGKRRAATQRCILFARSDLVGQARLDSIRHQLTCLRGYAAWHDHCVIDEVKMHAVPHSASAHHEQMQTLCQRAKRKEYDLLLFLDFTGDTTSLEKWFVQRLRQAGVQPVSLHADPLVQCVLEYGAIAKRITLIQTGLKRSRERKGLLARGRSDGRGRKKKDT